MNAPNIASWHRACQVTSSPGTRPRGNSCLRLGGASQGQTRRLEKITFICESLTSLMGARERARVFRHKDKTCLPVAT